MDAIAALLAHGHVRRWVRHAHIVHPGAEPLALHYVIEGSISVNVLNDDRKRDYFNSSHDEFTAAHLTAGDFIGVAGLLGVPLEVPVIAQTRTPCSVRTLSFERCHQLLRRELAGDAAAIWQFFSRYLAAQLNHSTVRMAAMVAHSPDERIIQVLQNLCKTQDADDHPGGKLIRIAQYEIGRLAGCSRETTSVVMKRLEDQQRVARSGRTVFVREAALA